MAAGLLGAETGGLWCPRCWGSLGFLTTNKASFILWLLRMLSQSCFNFMVSPWPPDDSFPLSRPGRMCTRFSFCPHRLPKKTRCCSGAHRVTLLVPTNGMALYVRPFLRPRAAATQLCSLVCSLSWPCPSPPLGTAWKFCAWGTRVP